MKITRNSGLVSIFFLVTLMLPSGLMAQKEETPSAPDKTTRASYYDFDDIRIPSELSLNKKNSIVYGTGRPKVGIMVFKGRVEPSSLAAFFQNNMQQDGWNLLSSFKYRPYLLIFLKEDRACVITITEKLFSTMAEIRVGPVEPGSVPIKGRQPH